MKRSATPTMSVQLLQVTIASAVRLGLEREAIIREAELGDEDLDDPDGRAPVTAAVRLSAVLRRHLGPSAAVQLGQLLASERGTILSYLAGNCRNLEEAYRSIERYRRIAFEVGRPQLTIDGDSARFGCAFPGLFVRMAPDAVELFVAFWLSKGRHLTGVEWTPQEIRLQSPQLDASADEALFRCPVHNKADRSELVFDAKLLALPVVGADPNLLHFLRPIADDILSGLPMPGGIIADVQSTIFGMLQAGEPRLDGVAAALGLSSRTLQRRLEAEDTNFAALLDEARRVAAFKYLRDRRISVTDTALLLGFSEPSTFYRAFKRWTGQTPVEYRRSLAA